MDDSIFDDQARLFERDTGGMLRFAALAGAQVRSVSDAAAEAGLGEPAEDKPRALVLLSRPGVGAGAIRVLAALLGPTCPVPVVLSEVVPTWVGPLDVVFAYSDEGGDAALAESLEMAGRRGAGIVLAAPADGPVAAAVAGRAKLLPPRVPVPTPLGFGHVFAAGLCALAALGLLRVDTDTLADALDDQAARSHPRNETAENPAKNLALRLADRVPLLWGVDELSTAVASHGAFALGANAGVACDVAGHRQAAGRHALYRAAAATGSEADLFADPHEESGSRFRVVLLSARADERSLSAERAAVAGLPGADLLTPPDSIDQDPVLRSALLAASFDMAAVYLGLASGVLDGPGWPVLAAQ